MGDIMKEINIEDLNFNAFDLLKDWALVSAINKDKFNTMTISWGGFGSLFDTYVATIYIRPQRYTKQFIDNSEYFTLSFFDNKYKNDLTYLGRHSGLEENKVSKTNLNPIINENIVYFNEAKLVFICKKLFCEQMRKESFNNKEILNEMYPNKDYSYMYIAKIEKILVNE